MRKAPLVHVDVGLFADDIGQTAANTFDGGHGEHYLLLAIDVGVEHSQNVLELFVRNQRLHFRIPQTNQSSNTSNIAKHREGERMRDSPWLGFWGSEQLGDCV